MTPFAYATPHSNSTYVPKSYGREVEVYEDESDEDYFVGVESYEEKDSTTDVSVDGNDSYDGYDQNALSDYETAYQNDDEGHVVGNAVWEGLTGDGHDSRYPRLGNQSAANDHIVAQAVHDDAASDISETPSEYPSTQQRIDQRHPEPAIILQPLRRVKAPGLYERRQKRGTSFTIHVDDEASDPK